MTNVERAWAIGAIVATVLTAAYGKELRIVFDTIPNGFRAVRIAVLKTRLTKYSKAFSSTSAQDVMLVFLTISIMCSVASYIYVNAEKATTKKTIVEEAATMICTFAISGIADIFNNLRRERIVAKTRAKLKRYGIEPPTENIVDTVFKSL